MYALFLKRIIDFIIALIVLVVSLPMTIIVYFLLVFQNKGSAFFYQNRPGFNQKPFNIVKFKTMSDATDSNGILLPDNQRITKFGKIIRQLSIDELPQLLNVLKGEMSLVGPRPLLFKYIPLYNNTQLRRHHAKPGITGWAQVNGRNTISWTKKFELDVYYVDNVSLFLDLKILGLTVIKVIKKDGINQTADRPMMPFNGSN